MNNHGTNKKVKVNIPDNIAKLSPYKAGKPINELKRERGLETVVKLASNENPLGGSKLAEEAIRKGLYELNRYPDPANYELHMKLSEKFSKSPDEMLTASGSDSLIQYVLLAFSNEHDIVLSSEATFIGWNVNVDKLNRIGEYVPLKNYKIDLDAIAKAIRPETKIIYLANPNNPTGTIFTKVEFESFMKKVPENILVILDEAYILYASFDEIADQYPNGLDYEIPNLLVLRTFSKDFGLAGLRLGVCFGHKELIEALRKVRLPFEPSNLSQLGVVAALEDYEFLVATREQNAHSLKHFRNLFTELKIECPASSANFLMMLFENEDTAFRFNEECLKRGLILRYLKSFGIPNGIRINSGTEAETEFAVKVIREAHAIIFNAKYATI